MTGSLLLGAAATVLWAVIAALTPPPHGWLPLVLGIVILFKWCLTAYVEGNR